METVDSSTRLHSVKYQKTNISLLIMFIMYLICRLLAVAIHISNFTFVS